MKTNKLTQKYLSLTKKSQSPRQSRDKQNNHLNINLQNKENLSHVNNYYKTGIEIRNKIKSNKENNINSRDKYKQTLARILPMRTNSFLNQNSNKPYKKMFNYNHDSKFNNQNQNQSCNLSTNSSTKSLKSVTFSVDSQNTKSLSMSRNGQRSILKNKINTKNTLNQSQKKSISSSHCSHIKNLDQSVQNQNSNNIILQKYQKILQQLKLNNQKYTDTIYPPCEQSIFLKNQFNKNFNTKLTQDGYKIRWMRIPELFKNKKICLWNPQHKTLVTKGFINLTNNKDFFIPNVFNSINKKFFIQKIFESQQICDRGIYYAKIHQTQTNTWKYIIIDDYIPVVTNKNSLNQQKILKPAFLNIKSSNQSQKQKDQVIEIWPFLLQKAFAKYYSTYDTLLQGITLDFLEQVTGNFYKTFQLKKQTINNNKYPQQQNTIQKSLKNQFNIVIGQTQNGMLYPFRSSQQSLQIIDIQNESQPYHQISKQQLAVIFTKIHIIQSSKYVYQKNCFIKQQNLLEKELKDHKKPFILRSFTVQEGTQCHLGLIQKQERFHRGKLNYKTNQKVYQYSWIRMILVMKEPNGYRWIDSAYSNTKTTKIQTSLQPGQYFIIILPQWAQKPFNLNLSLLTNTYTTIQRKPYQSHLTIIQQSCMDLAQRYGKLIQINPNICAYNFIDYKIGFIIENINNEKSSGEVKILRTIEGLESYNIVPINEEFLKNKKLEIKIKSLDSYTVVLKVLGGVDRAFLQQFDFGS